MAKVKEMLSTILTCSYCYGQGWQYTGNGEDYDVWACDCNPYNIPYDEVQDYHELFKTKENA